MKEKKGAILWVFVLFLFSGGTGLAYQVIWTRMLIRTFGATSLAVSTVLAGYMAGLALGSYIFGRIIDRRGNPILVYGGLELGIGVFALVFPFLTSGLTPFYRAIYPSLSGSFYVLSFVRFLLCFVMLLVPTTLMGGTLPVLSKYVTESVRDLTLRASWLYAVNTFGAVGGIVVTGFVLLPEFGMRATTYAVVLVNVGIFIVSVFLARGSARVAIVSEGVKGSEVSLGGSVKITRAQKVVLVGFLGTGLAALSAEVIWTRVLTLVVGTTVYAFSIMLVAFLLGLAVGTAIFARFAQGTKHPGRALSLVVLAIGLSVYVSMVLFGRMPFAYMRLYELIGRSWANLVWMQFLLSLALVLVSTFLMGGVFPLVARIYATDEERVGNRIGTAYAFNTVGCIAGSLMGSFVFLRFLGVRNGMALVSAIYVGVGLLLWFLVAERMRRNTKAIVGSAVIVAATLLTVFAPPWDKKAMTSGIYIYAPFYRNMDAFKKDLEARNLLFYNEGPGATVSVDRTNNVLALRIDGKADASSGSDMITQELVAHLPLLLHPHPDTVLTIGLGSGVSLSSALTHDLKYVECVELLENVIEAAHFFDDLTRSCMDDPRARIIVGDGRNHVLLTERKYDVIISEPTNPWISGVGDLFTLEFFSHAKARLKPGGIMSAMLNTYHMGESDLKSGLKSFIQVFPYVYLWFASQADLIVVGSNDPIVIGEELISRMKRPLVREDLERVGIDEPEDLLSAILMDRSELAEFVKGDFRLNTDDNMLLEYHASRRTGEKTEVIHLQNILKHYKSRNFSGLPPPMNESIAERVLARKMTLQGVIEWITSTVIDKALWYFDEAYSIAPEDNYVRAVFAERHLRIAEAYLRDGKIDLAYQELQRATVDKFHPDAWRAFDRFGSLLVMLKDLEGARANLEEACRLNPFNAASHYNLGVVLVALGDTTNALTAFERAHNLNPQDPNIRHALERYGSSARKDLHGASGAPATP